MQPRSDSMKSEIVIELQSRPEPTSWANNRDQAGVQELIRTLDIFVCAYKGDVLVGFARALSDGRYRALIDDVVVDSGFRKRGVGKLLVSSLMSQLRPVDEVFLNAGFDLEEFYNIFGFKKFVGLTMVCNR